MQYRNHYSTPVYSDETKSYYGNVTGAPEIPEIRAATLHDYERLFHQAVDDHLKAQGVKKVKWGRITGFAIIGILLVMALTCPKKEKHVEVLTDRVTYVVDDLLGGQDAGIKLLGSFVGNTVSKPVINKSINLRNFLFFNVCTLTFRGEEYIVSVGAFGHVFTYSREALKDKVREKMDLQYLLDLF